jgi:formate dehydrogenase major subunit
VTDRLRPLRVEGRTVHQVWLPYHWGSGGLVTGDSANDLFGISLDPNVLIQETKVGTCDVRPGRRPRGRAGREMVAAQGARAGVASGDYPVIVTTGPGPEGGGKSNGDPTPDPAGHSPSDDSSGGRT